MNFVNLLFAGRITLGIDHRSLQMQFISDFTRNGPLLIRRKLTARELGVCLGRLRLHLIFTRICIEEEVPSGECVPESPTNPGYVASTFPGPDCTSWKD